MYLLQGYLLLVVLLLFMLGMIYQHANQVLFQFPPQPLPTIHHFFGLHQEQGLLTILHYFIPHIPLVWMMKLWVQSP